MWTILRVMRITTLTELKILSFLAPSSVSQATDFFRPPSLGHGVELSMQVNLPPLSVFSRETSLFRLSFPGVVVVPVGVAPTEPARSLVLGSQALHEASFPCRRSSREISPSPRPPWGTVLPAPVLTTGRAVPSSWVPPDGKQPRQRCLSFHRKTFTL